jgi:hypothetical protein
MSSATESRAKDLITIPKRRILLVPTLSDKKPEGILAIAPIKVDIPVISPTLPILYPLPKKYMFKKGRDTEKTAADNPLKKARAKTMLIASKNKYKKLPETL